MIKGAVPVRRSAFLLALLLGLGGVVGAGAPAVAAGPHDPFGNVERVIPVPGGVRLVGWAIDPDTSAPLYLWVTVDDAGGTVQAMNHLAERGAKRIALVGGEPRAMGAAARAQAYLSWHGAGFEPTLVEHGDFGYESGRTATERLLAREPGIDAIFAASDRMALGAIEAARGIGRRVPEDLLVIGFDDQRSAATSDPPLSTIRQPIRAIGRAAVGALLAALADQTPSDLTFPTELVVRSST